MASTGTITTSIVGVIIEHEGLGNNKIQHTTVKAEQVQGASPRVKIKQGAAEITLSSPDFDLCVKEAVQLMAKKRLVKSL